MCTGSRPQTWETTRWRSRQEPTPTYPAHYLAVASWLTASTSRSTSSVEV